MTRVYIRVDFNVNLPLFLIMQIYAVRIVAHNPFRFPSKSITSEQRNESAVYERAFLQILLTDNRKKRGFTASVSKSQQLRMVRGKWHG